MAQENERALVLRVDSCRTSDGNTALIIEIGVCEWDGVRPRGLGHADDSIAWTERLYSDHPNWGACGELGIRETLAYTKLPDIRAMVKRADAIERKIARVSETAGRASTLGANALRFANAVGGIKKIVLKDSQGEWVSRGVKDIEWSVDRVVEAFRKAHAKPDRECSDRAADSQLATHA